jgi:hypothetical protein
MEKKYFGNVPGQTMSDGFIVYSILIYPSVPNVRPVGSL